MPLKVHFAWIWFATVSQPYPHLDVFAAEIKRVFEIHQIQSNFKLIGSFGLKYLCCLLNFLSAF